jgi:hypothetical protein
MNWSHENYPASSEKFGALLNHLDPLKEFPHVGTPINHSPVSDAFSILPSTATNEWSRAGRKSKFFVSGMYHASHPSFNHA